MTEAERLAYFETLIGTPYKIGACGPEAFDCYGLVQEVQRRCYTVEMPDVPYRSATTRSQAEAMLGHAERQNWHQVEVHEARDGDLVLMGNVTGRDFHLGTYVVALSQPLVLHTSQTSGVVADDLPSLRSVGFNFLRIFRRHADSGPPAP